MSERVILGICAYHGDASASLVVEGKLVAAVEEERFRRVKHWAGFPAEAVKECLRMGGVAPTEVDRFAIGRDPRANLLRKVAFGLRRRPSLALVRDRLQNARVVGDVVADIARALELPITHVRARTDHVEHHPAHLASAFFVSPFDEAAVCAIDGFGDFVSTSWGVGRASGIDVLHRTYFPHSLGMLYLAVTQHLGFLKYGDEYKVMGLAPYGRPTRVAEVRELVKLRPKGAFELDLDCFRHWSEGAGMVWRNGEPEQGIVYAPKMEEILGPARAPGAPVEPRHEDLARSVQVVFEEAAFHVLQGVHDATGQHRLALAGGCAMNSVANGKIREHTSFREIFVQPAAADNGTSLGAAFHVWHQKLGRRRAFVMSHSYWGPEFNTDACAAALSAREADLASCGATTLRLDDVGERAAWAAERIADALVLGWYQGRMEWGARALGARSILADPRRSDMREIINTKIKFRERFRPFAPSILEESVNDWFVDAVPDPFMIQVYPVRPEKRATIPAVTHVDGSGRLQTVSRDANTPYWSLIKAFEKRTGVPIVLNTSFNENEPIVLRPEEALDCFLRTRMDALVLGPFAVEKRR